MPWWWLYVRVRSVRLLGEVQGLLDPCKTLVWQQASFDRHHWMDAPVISRRHICKVDLGFSLLAAWNLLFWQWASLLSSCVSQLISEKFLSQLCCPLPLTFPEPTSFMFVEMVPEPSLGDELLRGFSPLQEMHACTKFVHTPLYTLNHQHTQVVCQ